MSKIYKPHVYTIRTLTNLHVGGGSSNYDYVDKQVQRDPATNYPTIFSSGLKGAIRDYLTESGNEQTQKAIPYIFGNEPSDPTPKQGAYRFLSADLLAIPAPSDKPQQAYELVSSQQAQTTFKEKAQLMNPDINIVLEGLGTADEKQFKELVHELPVLSRNHLDNGVSQNLWYEEVVPRAAFFGFVILVPEEAGAENHFDTFNKMIDDKVIQIGANATIGYGLCHFKKIAG